MPLELLDEDWDGLTVNEKDFIPYSPRIGDYHLDGTPFTWNEVKETKYPINPVKTFSKSEIAELEAKMRKENRL